jgi:hypothetical protein
MITRRFLLTALLVASASLLTFTGLSNGPAVKAQDKTDGTTTTGFPTGTICKKSGTYRASNKYIENIIVVGEGETFPPFSDGTKTIWYPRNPAIKASAF